MDFGTALIVIFTILVALVLVAGLVLFIFALKTISDIRKIVRDVSEISDNIKKNKLSEAMKHPMVQERVVGLLS
ncbi:hypothetical protein N9L18_00430, partial [Candidatus Pacebacteria bacterium]|nr:hypothetical protein [Candidatus Paceibacterota bacterium]